LSAYQSWAAGFFIKNVPKEHVSLSVLICDDGAWTIVSQGVPAMKNIALLMTVFLSLAAHAAFECAYFVFSPGKKVVEGKLDLKPDKTETFWLSAEKNGYVFGLLLNESNAAQIEKLIVTQKATTRRSVSSFAGLKADNPNAIFMTGLLEDVGGPTAVKGARMTCKVKN
jgi:hypothetical protein